MLYITASGKFRNTVNGRFILNNFLNYVHHRMYSDKTNNMKTVDWKNWLKVSGLVTKMFCILFKAFNYLPL